MVVKEKKDEKVHKKVNECVKQHIAFLRKLNSKQHLEELHVVSIFGACR